MPDTVRTLAALQALLADNTAGDISAQDVRDMLVSTYSVRGAAVTATPVAINSLTDVSIASKTVTDVAAGDAIVARLWGQLINDSGAPRNYTFTPDFDGAFDAELTITIGNTTNPRNFYMEWVLGVVSSSVARFRGSGIRNTASTSAGVWDTNTASFECWDESVADLTGSVVVSFAIRSSDAATTQTFTPYQFVVQHFSGSLG